MAAPAAGPGSAVRSRTLFLWDDGRPMRFYLRPGQAKLRLAPLVLAGGGRLCHVREPEAVLLVEPGEAAPDGAVSTQYVTECVQRNRRLPLQAFALPSAPPAAPPAAAPRGRLPFTAEEDAALLRAVRERGEARAGGRALWKELEQSGLTRHSWQAMRERFRRHLRQRQGPEPQPGPDPAPAAPGPADKTGPGSAPAPTAPGPALAPSPAPARGPANRAEPGPADRTGPSPAPAPGPAAGPADKSGPGPAQGPADKSGPGPAQGPADKSGPGPAPGPAPAAGRRAVPAPPEEAALLAGLFAAANREFESTESESDTSDISEEPSTQDGARNSPEGTASDLKTGLEGSAPPETQVQQEERPPCNYFSRAVGEVVKTMQHLMEKFGVDLVTVTQAFLKNSGEVEAASYFLQTGQRLDGYPIWSREDDLELQKDDEHSRNKLIAKFGVENVAKRIGFRKS